MKASGYRPDMQKRGSLRSVFDGRYKLTRFFRRWQGRAVDERENQIQPMSRSARSIRLVRREGVLFPLSQDGS